MFIVEARMADTMDDSEGWSDSLREDCDAITDVFGDQVRSEQVKECVKRMKDVPDRRQAVINILLNPAESVDDHVGRLSQIFPTKDREHLQAVLRQADNDLDLASAILLGEDFLDKNGDNEVQILSADPSKECANLLRRLLDGTPVNVSRMVHAVVAGEITIEMFVDFVPADLSERLGDRVQAVTTLRSGMGDLRSAIAKGAIVATTLREADTASRRSSSGTASTPSSAKRSSSGTASTPSSSKRARLSQESVPSSDWSEQSEIGQDDAVLMAVQEISERFPDADPNMLYNRLVDAADLDFARDAIIQELLPPEADEAPELSVVQLSRIDSTNDVDAPSTSRTVANFLSMEEQRALRHITGMFPDVDPHFIVEKLAQEQWSEDELIQHMSSQSYPKLKHRISKERRERRRREFIAEDRFDVADFLVVFNDPETYFSDQTRSVSQLYIDHSIVHLLNAYPNMQEAYLKRVLEEHNNHLLPTIRALEGADESSTTVNTSTSDESDVSSRGRRRRGRKRRIQPKNNAVFLPAGQDRLTVLPWPDEIEENFFRELQYLTHKNLIEGYLAHKRSDRVRRIDEARAAGELQECACCFCDDILAEDMVACESNAHKFCRDCVSQHANTQVGDGGYTVKCMDEGCKRDFSLRALRTLLRPQVVDLILRRSQQAELRSAQLDNMEACPFCDFALIIENPDERLFRCQNPDCLKESCRECKEESHIPLRCDEVEKDVETRMRTFIENKMAEAMIRVCPSCSKRIIKIEGCNKMACSCGAFMCYVCQALLSQKNPYAHFEDGPRKDGKRACMSNTPMTELHDEAARKAGQEAREKFMKENPALKDIKDVDVSKLVGAKGVGSRKRKYGKR